MASFGSSFAPRSGNAKLGGIPMSISSAETCPSSCLFFGDGCFAEDHLLRAHWARTPERGLTWALFLEEVRALPAGALWRHNVAGDLAGRDGTIDGQRLAELVVANVGRRGFTFTHKPLGARAREAVAWSNALGLTINLSANNPAHADRLARLDIAPVAVVLRADHWAKSSATPEGRRIIVCPAETTPGITCANCGLCARPGRETIIGFRAHGYMKRRVTDLVQLRRKS